MEKKLILLEARNLVIKAKRPMAPQDIADRLATSPDIPRSTAEGIASAVRANTDFCAYSEAQAQKKLASVLNEAPWESVVAAYKAATEEAELNMDLVELISKMQQEIGERVRFGILTNSFWFSTPGLKAALPEGLFDLFFQSGDLRCRKPWSQIYSLVESITGMNGKDILLLDNFYSSVVEARTHGWTAELADGNTSKDIIQEVFNAFVSITAEMPAPAPVTTQPEKTAPTAPASFSTQGTTTEPTTPPEPGLPPAATAKTQGDRKYPSK